MSASNPKVVIDREGDLSSLLEVRILDDIVQSSNSRI